MNNMRENNDANNMRIIIIINIEKNRIKLFLINNKHWSDKSNMQIWHISNQIMIRHYKY